MFHVSPAFILLRWRVGPAAHKPESQVIRSRFVKPIALDDLSNGGDADECSKIGPSTFARISFRIFKTGMK